jgi:osmotically-inducible protein OsmY
MFKNTAAFALAIVCATGAVACSSNPEKGEGPAEATASNAGRVVDDTAITAKVKAALIGDPQTKANQINVQLSGFVDSADSRARALEVARNVDGVKEVKDGLEVRGST